MMKYVILGFLALFSASSFSHTITYDNGDVYTVADNEYVFVSTQPNVWTYHPYSKSVQFKKIWPTEKVDYVPVDNGTDPSMAVGSHEWCLAYVPWSEGFTFSMQAWQRYCDSNNDGVYDSQDERWGG